MKYRIFAVLLALFIAVTVMPQGTNVNNVNPGVATVYVIFSKNGEEKGVIPVWFLIEKGGGGEQD